MASSLHVQGNGPWPWALCNDKRITASLLHKFRPRLWDILYPLTRRMKEFILHRKWIYRITFSRAGLLLYNPKRTEWKIVVVHIDSSRPATANHSSNGAMVARKTSTTVWFSDTWYLEVEGSSPSWSEFPFFATFTIFFCNYRLKEVIKHALL